MTISRVYNDDGTQSILIEENDGILSYLDSVKWMRKMILEKKTIDRDREGNHYYAKIIREVDISEKNGIVVTKIKRLYVFELIKRENGRIH